MLSRCDGLVVMPPTDPLSIPAAKCLSKPLSSRVAPRNRSASASQRSLLLTASDDLYGKLLLLSSSFRMQVMSHLGGLATTEG